MKVYTLEWLYKELYFESTNNYLYVDISCSNQQHQVKSDAHAEHWEGDNKTGSIINNQQNELDGLDN